MNKSWIANGVTAANALFGGLAIMLSLMGEFKTAAICIILAMIADALDGRVARALHTAGPMGVELDSLSDDISFGIASGTLIFAYQLHEWGIWGAIPCALLGAFCAFRLARFNVKVDTRAWILRRTTLSDHRRSYRLLRIERRESMELVGMSFHSPLRRTYGKRNSLSG